MQVRPKGWEFDPIGEFCCYSFKMNVINSDGLQPIIIQPIFTDGKDVYFEGKKISYCPYCGKKIELEKEVKQ